MAHRVGPAAIVLALVALQGCATLAPQRSREPLPHFFRVDQGLYRGGQPTPEGFRQLAQRGIRTVIDLRVEPKTHRKQEQQLVESLGMRWVSLPMRWYWRPSDAQVIKFLQVALDPSQQPVFVHCRKGRNRTGTLVAVYRIVAQSWSPERAYAEARNLGLSRWNPLTRHIIFREAQQEYVPATASFHRSRLVDSP